MIAVASIHFSTKRCLYTNIVIPLQNNSYMLFTTLAFTLVLTSVASSHHRINDD